MTCKKVKRKALWEQDRWLSYLPTKDDPNLYDNDVIYRKPTDKERIDFLHYDSHGPKGSKMSPDNIIFAGKLAARAIGDCGWFPWVDELFEIYMDPKRDREWPGGLALMEDYLWRVCGIKPLRKKFGDYIVHRWLSFFLWHAFGWKITIEL